MTLLTAIQARRDEVVRGLMAEFRLLGDSEAIRGSTSWQRTARLNLSWL